MRALAAVLSLAASLASSQDDVITVKVDWTTPKITTSTAATVEVDVMPFLGEADWGGPFAGYKKALSNLGSEFVRMSPWFANPEVVVPELKPAICNATSPATNWNSTLFDQVIADFYGAVCGPNAAEGKCEHSVVQQLSTMPAWMYDGGYNRPLPAYPWNTTDPFDAYGAGGSYVDKTCGQVARFFGRIVGWYTNGGFHDECGHFHESKFHYKWYGLSVLNEDEHHITPENGPAYTQCYDAIKVEVGKVNKDIVLVGPEIVGGSWSWEYMQYFLDAANHADKQAPPIASWHWFGGMFHNATAEDVLTRWMHDYYDPHGIVQQIHATIKASGQKTEVVLNEFIPFIDDYCNCTGHELQCNNESLPTGIGKSKCPNWQLVQTGGGGGAHDSTKGKGIGINRATWSWNAAAAVFALGYATLAELGYKIVGADQLVGGVWPDNEPAVSCLDWQTGEPNAKYWAIHALATTVGSTAPKTLYQVSTTHTATSAPALPLAATRQATAPAPAAPSPDSSDSDSLPLSPASAASLAACIDAGRCHASTATSYQRNSFRFLELPVPGSSIVHTTPPPAPLRVPGCYIDSIGGVSYIGGNIFGSKHMVNTSATADGCCKMCAQYSKATPHSAACVFFQWDEESCYGHPGPCCRLKSSAAWKGRTTQGPPTATTGSILPLQPTPAPPPPPTPPPPPSPVHVMAYKMGGKKGMLVVNLKARIQALKLAGVSGGTATVIEVATSGPDAATPGFAKPITRKVPATGEFSLGPFGIAVIHELEY